MPQSELLDASELRVSPPPVPQEVGLKLQRRGCRNPLIALVVQDELRKLCVREDYSSLPETIRHELGYIRALAFESLHPPREDLGHLQRRMQLYGGRIYDFTGAMVERWEETIEQQEQHWGKQGYEGDALSFHQEQEAADALARAEGGTVTVFGSARRGPGTPVYEAIRWMTSAIIRGSCQEDGTCERVLSGGGSGLMEAANRGAREGLLSLLQGCQAREGAGGVERDRLRVLQGTIRAQLHSLGIRIVLPKEAIWNPYLEQNITMRKFAPRKQALVSVTCGRSTRDQGVSIPWHRRHPAFFAAEGGFGTWDETFETLCLMQCEKMPRVPFFVVGRKPVGKWLRDGLRWMEDHGLISPEDKELITFCDNECEAARAYFAHYGIPPLPSLEREMLMRRPLLSDRILAKGKRWWRTMLGKVSKVLIRQGEEQEKALVREGQGVV
jgi:predicted Rossmann-fold nucleotide-binding protein